MVTVFGMLPQELYYISFSFLIFILTLLAIIITIASVYAIVMGVKIGKNIEESLEEVKKKAKKTFRVFDVFLDLFAGDDECEEENGEEVYVLKKKK